MLCSGWAAEVIKRTWFEKKKFLAIANYVIYPPCTSIHPIWFKVLCKGNTPVKSKVKNTRRKQFPASVGNYTFMSDSGKHI